MGSGEWKRWCAIAALAVTVAAAVAQWILLEYFQWQSGLLILILIWGAGALVTIGLGRWIQNSNRVTAIVCATAATMLLLVGLIGPIGNVGRDDRARRASCLNNLRQIGAGMTQYARDHDGVYPKSFAEMLQEGYPEDRGLVPLKMFWCPSAKKPEHFDLGKELKGAGTEVLFQVEDEGSYEMVPGTWHVGSGENIIACDKRGNHDNDWRELGRGRNCLMDDGAVKWMTEEEFQKRLHAQGKGEPVADMSETELEIMETLLLPQGSWTMSFDNRPLAVETPVIQKVAGMGASALPALLEIMRNEKLSFHTFVNCAATCQDIIRKQDANYNMLWYGSIEMERVGEDFMIKPGGQMDLNKFCREVADDVEKKSKELGLMGKE